MYNVGHSQMHDLDDENELTPDILFARISQLEEDLATSKLTKESMNELLDLYNVNHYLN